MITAWSHPNKKLSQSLISVVDHSLWSQFDQNLITVSAHSLIRVWSEPDQHQITDPNHHLIRAWSELEYIMLIVSDHSLITVSDYSLITVWSQPDCILWSQSLITAWSHPNDKISVFDCSQITAWSQSDNNLITVWSLPLLIAWSQHDNSSSPDSSWSSPVHSLITLWSQSEDYSWKNLLPIFFKKHESYCTIKEEGERSSLVLCSNVFFWKFLF